MVDAHVFICSCCSLLVSPLSAVADSVVCTAVARSEGHSLSRRRRSLAVRARCQALAGGASNAVSRSQLSARANLAGRADGTSKPEARSMLRRASSEHPCWCRWGAETSRVSDRIARVLRMTGMPSSTLHSYLCGGPSAVMRRQSVKAHRAWARRVSRRGRTPLQRP